MTYYAHSPKNGIPAQTYAAHIRDVSALASQYVREVERYAKVDGSLLCNLIDRLAPIHDFGKLSEVNQEVLSGAVEAERLPENHVDAGVAYELCDSRLCALSAIAIRAHHTGFPDFTTESNREEMAFRDAKIAAKVDAALYELEAIHKSLVEEREQTPSTQMPQGDLSMFLRILLSCVVDADHVDTARHYRRYPLVERTVELRAKERLEKLDAYVANLSCESGADERNALRREMYWACRNADIEADICSCDGSVGTGKTTAVMAHMLIQALKRGLRRIFVILPYTNIIVQSVKRYREMLTLPGERPEDAVSELHHRADFESEDARHLTALWRAPIIVTTAVAFFETLASNSTATLRRLHSLPGSAIFVDESHAALPASLLPIAWKWMNIMSCEWCCYWTLASGSMCRFWTIPEIAPDAQIVHEIANDTIRAKLAAYEGRRIAYRYDPVPKSALELIELVDSCPGPRLVIVNTVQSAAVLAYCYAKKYGRAHVEHLSTSLKPCDRETTLERVISRLKDKSDTDWVLIATSCVEAGLDLSFRTGFRELASLLSLLQAAGRIGREGEFVDALIWTFRLKPTDLITQNPGVKQASEILKRYFDEGEDISTQLATRSISEEIALYGLGNKHKSLIEYEAAQNFPRVEHDFKVIDSDTCLAVVDDDIAKRLHNGEIDWRGLQSASVRIAKNKLDKLNIPRILESIYHWNLGYDDFLGYMAGIITE